MPRTSAEWNRLVLACHLERLAALVGHNCAARADGEDHDVESQAREALQSPTALDRLVDSHRLSSFERDVVLATVVASLDPGVPVPTVRWALATLPGADLEALRPDRPLRRARLVVADDGPIMSATLHADARVVWHLQGCDVLDERLDAYVTEVAAPSRPLPESRSRAGAVLAQRWANAPAHLAVHGPGAADRRDVVALGARLAGRPLFAIAATDLPRGPVERDGFARLWSREAALTAAVLLIEIETDAPPETFEAVAIALARLRGAVAVSTTFPATARVDSALAVPRPSREEQRQLWIGVLAGRASSREAAAEELSRRYDLDHADILCPPSDLDPVDDDDATTDLAAATLTATGFDAAVRRSRRIVRARLDPLAERIDPRAQWHDLVIAPAQLRLLRHFAATAAGRAKLPPRAYGRDAGLTAMFAGPSGTGKTLAAEVLAREMGLDLYRIDLPATVSKWIGETERNLRRLFDAAEQGGVVLLFDEADALFGQRSEVRDSHDRYANLEVSYLLQRMEQYRGVAILTTNMRSAIDRAFLRRLRFVVQFNHPTIEDRARLWERSIPADLDGDGIDRERLVRLDLTGGQIRTVAEQAALAALGDGGTLTMEHIRDAVAAEFAKHDRPLAELETWR